RVLFRSGESITFEGSGKLVERPLDIYYKIFDKQGIKYKNSFGKLPLTLCGKLKPDNFYVRGDISSQFITGLMYALPLLEGDSQITLETPLQSKGYVDLTMDVLKSFGIIIENNNYNSFKIQGKQSYVSRKFTVEGDFSQAAFWLAGGVLSGTTVCQGLNMDSLQGDRDITRIIQAMGGNLKIKNNGVTAHKSDLKGIEIDASQIPDLVPIISVIASLSKGRTIIKNAGRLRIKESDRLKAIASELNKIGGKIVEQDEGLVIEGVNSFGGGIVDSWNDHRIAMALAIAAARCKEPLIITGEKFVNKSYPRFWEDFKKLGGEIHEWNMGE
ncbi:MAG: 3-phosphoshikimate 1-carboxyvinyltransferase, partial [Lutispora sp.]|nr:3-phosphoshikimate 1-carboxyvinyltransferase [Lutispora sp.]